MNARLGQQLAFILELDKLKEVLRQSYLLNSERRENSAEHSWHLALMALILAEHANEAVDIEKVLKMLLLHDVVEIDAGDTYIYDTQGSADKAERETRAAERLFGLLPSEQAAQCHALWQEYEMGESAEARFGNALDRLMPLLHNYHTQGRSWQEHGIHSSQVIERNSKIQAGSEALWEIASQLISDAVDKGWLAR